MFDKYHGRCAYCGVHITFNNMHIDHIQAKQRGVRHDQQHLLKIKKGGDNIENLNPSCAPCNLSKNSHSIDSWRDEIKLKSDRLYRDDSRFRLLVRFDLIKLKKSDDFKFYFETQI